MASLEVGRVLTQQIGHGPLSGSFEMLLTATPLFVVQQPARTLGLSCSAYRGDRPPVPFLSMGRPEIVV